MLSCPSKNLCDNKATLNFPTQYSGILASPALWLAIRKTNKPTKASNGQISKVWILSQPLGQDPNFNQVEEEKASCLDSGCITCNRINASL